MTNQKKALLVFACVLFGASTAFARTPLWVDLKDVAQYRPDLMPDAELILDSMRNRPNLYGPEGALVSGGVELQSVPLFAADGKSLIYRNVAVLMDSPRHQFFFRFFTIEVDQLGKDRQVSQVIIENDIPLSKTRFTINVGLIERILILNDVENNIEIIYPIGVGGIDPGVITAGSNQILTPLFAGAGLKRSSVIISRHTPTYYRDEPFMPITNRHNILTPIAFHVTILSDDDWANRGGNYLIRGFDSHGCMRLRLKDLTELFNVVMYGGLEELPVDVNLFAGVPIELHPYPLNIAYYQRVKNFAPEGLPPQFQRDPLEDLVVMEAAPGQPDYTTLSGFSADEITDLKIFEGITEALPEASPSPAPSTSPTPSVSVNPN